MVILCVLLVVYMVGETYFERRVHMPWNLHDVHLNAHEAEMLWQHILEIEKSLSWTYQVQKALWARHDDLMICFRAVQAQGNWPQLCRGENGCLLSF